MKPALYRALLVVILFFLCVSSKTTVPDRAEDVKDLNPFELLKLGQDVLQLFPHEPQPADVTFYFTSLNLSKPVLTTSTKSMLDASKKTKILIHGWLENHRRSWYQGIADQYLETGDFNIVEVDWETVARMPYIYSAKSVQIVGQWVAQFIEEASLLPANVHIIGHSLGAHVASFAGKAIFSSTGQKVSRITALDPAGPYFRFPTVKPSERLNQKDAVVVDVIHTDAGFYGLEDPTGTLDIYVNGGGRIQPGCLDFTDNVPESIGDILETSFCSHARSVKYFIEWIHRGKFKCTFHHAERMLASEDVNSQLTGVCFANTHQHEPYLI
uniref:Lipase domain-containing protein n=1 Tax=Dendroctonus ponderosae TaxID=77166 RepID=J3JYS6_DENPD|nr:unknown [Dendroctonus ponderosae]